MNIVRAIACLTPFPAEFITIMPVGLRPPGGPGGQKIEFFWDGPGCFGGCRGVIPEYFYGIFEGF